MMRFSNGFAMRGSLFALMLPLALAACAPEVPESGVGFTAYGSAVNPRPVGSVAPTQPVFSTERLGAAIDAAEGRGPVASGPVAGVDLNDPNRPRGNEPTTIRPEIGEMVRPATISDEQDFDAVAARETIESDAERIARNRAQYTVIQPGALPVRPGESGPNIVEYALATNHPPGVQLYRRSALRFTDPLVACARYGSPDRAQEAFLAAGGPERDRRGLDPDGDGYACGWDPRPFRAVR